MNLLNIWLLAMMLLPMVEMAGRIGDLVSAEGRQVFRVLYVSGGFITAAHIIYALREHLGREIQETQCWLVWSAVFLLATAIAVIIQFGSKTTK